MTEPHQTLRVSIWERAKQKAREGNTRDPIERFFDALAFEEGIYDSMESVKKEDPCDKETL